MAELLSPGVFIEEIASEVQVIQGVSTSNAGFVGFTSAGPENDPTLVTSFEQFTRIFGPLTPDSFLPLSVAAFFANGGQRAFVVRVTPADAVDAECKILSEQTDQHLSTGDGVLTAFSDTAPTPVSALKVNGGASPIVPGSMSFKWRGIGAATAADPIKSRDNTSTVVLVAAQADYEGRIDPATLGQYLISQSAPFTPTDEEQYVIVPGTFVLNFDPDGATPTTLAVTTKTAVASATSGAGTVVTVDHRTGIFSVKFAGAEIPSGVPGAFTTDFTLADTPAASAYFTATDAATPGTLAGDNDAGSVNYDDGTWSLTLTTEIPHDQAPILVDYTIDAWDLDPVSGGTWANNMRIQIVGNEGSFDADTGQYSLFDVRVLQLNSATGNYDISESYDELSFDNSASALYFPDVLNDLSDLLTVTEPGSDEAPQQLFTLGQKSEALAGGDETTGGRQIGGLAGSGNEQSLSGSVQPRTLTITWTDDTGVTRTVTDDGNGNLTGDVDTNGLNTINYTTGALDVLLGFDIQGGTLALATYYQPASDSTYSQDFGDTTQVTSDGTGTGSTAWVAGTNGTFDATNYGRNQFTAPGTLQTNLWGLYALDKVEELMQVVVPDFAGDTTISGDILDYVDGRVSLPAGGDRFAILAAPIGSSPQETVDWLKFDFARKSRYAAVYGPWIKVADPLSDGRDLTMPPMGHVAGIYARTDSTKNVGKAPAGTVDGQLNFLTGLEAVWSQGERDLVYQANINPLISSPQTGLAVWGSRTIAVESDWRQINARRLFMFVERSVWNATHWIVFENNGPALWTRIKAQLDSFLNNLFTNGYFAETTPAQAFRVVVDETNNDADSIALGQVIIDVAIAPNKPAEFVRFRFTQKTID